MAETILITGATGMVGKALTRVLLVQGYKINVLTTQKRLLGSNNDIHYFFWNPQSNEIDSKCFNKVTTVINLAGSPIAQRWTKSTKSSILNSRVQSLNTLANAIREHKINIKQLISASQTFGYFH